MSSPISIHHSPIPSSPDYSTSSSMSPIPPPPVMPLSPPSLPPSTRPDMPGPADEIYSPISSPGDSIPSPAESPETTPPSPPPAENEAIFSREILDSTLLNIFSTPYAPDASGLNLSNLRDADRTIWRARDARHVLNRVKKHRASFMVEMLKATEANIGQICEDFATEICKWLVEVEEYPMKLKDYSRKVRKATAMEISHRSDYFLYPEALRVLAETPNVGSLLRVKSALEQLWFVINIAQS